MICHTLLEIPQEGQEFMLIPFSWWEMAWKPSALYLRYPEESPWHPREGGECSGTVQFLWQQEESQELPDVAWSCSWQRRICVPAVTVTGWTEGPAGSQPGSGSGQGPACRDPAGTSGRQWRLQPTGSGLFCFPSALEKEWKEVRQPPGSAGSLWTEPCLCPRPATLLSTLHPPGQHLLPSAPGTASLPGIVGRLSAWPLHVSLGFQPHPTSIQPPPRADHHHLPLPLPWPHVCPLPFTTPKPEAALPSIPSHVLSLLEREEMCYDFWKLQGLPQCWFAPLDLWEQGLGDGSCCAPVSCSRRSGGTGGCSPHRQPQTWHCTSWTNTGPGDVVSGVLTKTQEPIVLLTHPHGHNCARRARRAAPAAAWEELQPEQQSLSHCPLSTPKGVHWVYGTLGSFPEPV